MTSATRSEPPTPAPTGGPRVLIVGGGYAGAHLARALDAAVDVTLVERRDRFAHSVAAILAVADLSWLDRVGLSYDQLLTRGRVVRGDVREVRTGGVALADGRVIEAEVVVLAPGSSYASPFKPVGGEDHATYEARVRAVHARLRASRSVVVVGAGPVGIELAGEVRAAFPETRITLISAGATLLPGYRPALARKLARDLGALGVDLMLGRRAVGLPPGGEPYGPARVALDAGPAVEADLVFTVLGARPNTAFLEGAPGVALDGRGRILVDEHLRVPGLPGVFAIGDAALTADTQTISGADRQVAYLATLLRRLVASDGLAGSEPADSLVGARPYAAWPRPVLAVPVGPERGASQLPLGIVAGAWLTSRLKGRGLFADQTRKSLGL